MKLKRLLALLLAMATLFLAACSTTVPSSDDTNATDSVTETDPSDTEPQKDDEPANGLTSGLQIAYGGRSEYKIIIGTSPSGDTTTITEVASALRDIIFEMTGIRVRISQATQSNVDDKEIVIGNTCRETDGIYSVERTLLGTNGYQIKTIDQRIIIDGTSDESYWQAANTFCREFVGYDAYSMPTVPKCSFLYVTPQINVVVTDSSTGKVGPISIKIDGVDISDYLILTGKGFASAGQIISSAVKKIQNVSVNVYNDETTKKLQDREIVIGPTSRDGNQINVDISDLADDECRIQMVGTRLLVSAKSYDIAKSGLSKFFEEYLNYTSKDSFSSMPTEDIDVKLDGPVSYFTNEKAVDATFAYTQQGSVDYDAILTDSVTALLTTYGSTTPCFSDERIITLMLNKAKATIRNADYNISYVTSKEQCHCAACEKANQEEGTPYGAYYRAIAKIASTLNSDPAFSKHELIVSAYQNSFKMPAKVTFTPNVRIVICDREICSSHAIGDASCSLNAAYAQEIKKWCEKHSNVYVLDFTSDYYYFPATFPNLLTVRENVKFYAESGVEGLYLIWDEKQAVGEFATLRTELYKDLFANPYIDEEEYDKNITTILKGIYGSEDGARIRTYYDLFADAANDHCYTVFSFPSEILSSYDETNGKIVYKMDLMKEMFLQWAKVHPYYSALSHSKVYLAQMLFSRYQREPEAFAYVQFAYWLTDAVNHGDLSGVTDELFEYADGIAG